jgi:hypothetical protein
MRLKLLGILLLAFGYNARAEEPVQATLNIEAPATAVRGFPFMIRFTARGKQSVPLSSIFNSTAEIFVTFTNKQTGKAYQFNGYNKAEEITLSGPAGRMPGDHNHYRARIEDGEARAAAFEVSSLSTRGPTPRLSEMPDGEYALSIESPCAKLKSNALTVTLESPSADERSVLETLPDEGRRSWVNFFSWTPQKFLELKTQYLSKPALDQIALMTLFAKALSEPLNKETLEKIEHASVPEYLATEKACLVLELQRKIDPEAYAARKDTLRKNHPEIGWRLDEIESGKGVIATYSKESK